MIEVLTEDGKTLTGETASDIVKQMGWIVTDVGDYMRGVAVRCEKWRAGDSSKVRTDPEHPEWFLADMLTVGVLKRVSRNGMAESPGSIEKWKVQA